MIAVIATNPIQTPTQSILIDRQRRPPRFEVLFELATQLKNPTIQSTQDTTGEHSSGNQRCAEDKDVFDDRLAIFVAEKAD